ncbi:response regulator transcription factor [Nitriliruptoraceae bacterium ZYF776]|nr:response regulator transcription factor [Profundirhabdus halotolerans]
MNPEPAARADDRTSSARRPVRVVLADDQQLVRAGFRLVLERDPDIEVVAEAADGREAVDRARLHEADVVLMDLRMPRLDGIAATAELVDDPTVTTKVVVLTTYDEDDQVLGAVEAGASGYLLKDVEPAELRRAVHLVVAGESLLSPAVATRVLTAVRDQASRRPQGTDRLAVLTDREREVVALVGRGATNEEIGRALFVSPATAKTHVSRAMVKLRARDRVQLAILAIETGLTDP